MAAISLRKVVKSYGILEVVHGINLEIEHNKFIVLVGPSGCGKSTTLRMIAGLEEISDGEIYIGDRLVNELPPRKRNVSMVFQNYALYPHMNVRENLGFGLKIAKQSDEEVANRVNEAAEILGLAELLDRIPTELSGGQRQRVAMGRAIVRHPDAFLFDEPLSNLDAKLRVQMRTEIKKLHRRVATTIVYVTHDQVEAMTLADLIVVMKDGYIEQVGTPLEVFTNPANTFVASFIGSPPMNLLPAKIKQGQIKFPEGGHISIPESLAKYVKENQEIIFGIRPEDIVPFNSNLEVAGPTGEIELKVELSELLGSETIVYASMLGQEVQSKIHGVSTVNADEKMRFKIALNQAHFFDAKSQQSLRH